MEKNAQGLLFWKMKQVHIEKCLIAIICDKNNELTNLAPLVMPYILLSFMVPSYQQNI